MKCAQISKGPCGDIAKYLLDAAHAYFAKYPVNVVESKGVYCLPFFIIYRLLFA